jgi:integral membrane protein
LRSEQHVKTPLKTVVIRAFRILALAEAFSWAALLAGMYFKWVAGTGELGVQIAGPVHGALFVGYGATALALWRLQRWPLAVAFFAGLSAVFPFATIAFERWAAQRGHLAAEEALPSADSGAGARETAGV